MFAQLAKKFPDCYGKRMLIAVFKRVRHWTLSEPVESSPSLIPSIWALLTLPSYICLDLSISSCVLHSRSNHKPYHTILGEVYKLRNFSLCNKITEQRTKPNVQVKTLHIFLIMKKNRCKTFHILSRKIDIDYVSLKRGLIFVRSLNMKVRKCTRC
jgi:hypothetical protein